MVADSLQQPLVKTGRLVKHARYYRLVLAEGYLTWRVFGGAERDLSEGNGNTLD